MTYRENGINALYLKLRSLLLFVSYFEEKVKILNTNMDSTNEHRSLSIYNIPHFSVH